MKTFLIIITTFLIPIFAQANCKNLIGCLNKASKITGDKYIYGKELKGKVHHTKNFKLNKKNADLFISMVLNDNGYTRVPLKETKSYRIVNSRDIRYTPTQMLMPFS